MHVPVLYEDNHILIVNKPAGLPSQPNVAVQQNKSFPQQSESSLYQRLLIQLQQTSHKPNPFLRLNHRLDKPVSGLTILSKSMKATQRINRMFQQNQIQKYYLAVVCGTLVIDKVVESHLQKTPKYQQGNMHVSNHNQGISRFETIEHFPDSNPHHPNQPLTLIKVHLLTGKKHQIRSQLAELGHPIYNDYLYHASYPIRANDFSLKSIALHSYHLTFLHPVVAGKVIDITCPLPFEWIQYFSKSNWISKAEGAS